MNPFSVHLPCSGWQPAVYDPQTRILSTPWSEKKNDVELILNGGRVGWFFQASSGHLIPAVADSGGNQLFCRADGLLPLKTALKEVACQNLESASRIVCHDVGGALMGLDGLLGFWNEANPPGPEEFAEDYASIQEQIKNLNRNLSFLHWLVSVSQRQNRIVSLETLRELLELMLPRLIDRRGKVLLDMGRPEGLSCGSTHLIFWLLAFGRLASFLKLPGESMEIAFRPISGQDGFGLRVVSPSLRHNLGNSAPCSPQAHSYTALWLFLLASIQGTCDFPADSAAIDFVFPEVEFYSGPERMLWGFKQEHPASVHLADVSDPRGLVSAVLQHAFTLQSIEIPASAPSSSRNLAFRLAASLHPLIALEVDL